MSSLTCRFLQNLFGLVSCSFQSVLLEAVTQMPRLTMAHSKSLIFCCPVLFLFTAVGYSQAVVQSETIAPPNVFSSPYLMFTAADYTADLQNLDGGVIWPIDPAYEYARRPWQTFYQCNAYPSVVVEVDSENDVVRALNFANSRGLRVIVRNGGHSYAGISRTNGVVIDVQRLNEVVIATDGLTATVGAGQINIGAYYELALRNLSIPAGGCPSVGISGLTLGGGFGVLSRLAGLTSDQVTRIVAVVRNPKSKSYERVEITPGGEYDDLFYAFRGGMGGNYGVVTQWTYRTTPVHKVLDSEYEFNLQLYRNSATHRGNILKAIQTFMKWADDTNDRTYCEMSVKTENLSASDIFSRSPSDSVREKQLAKSFVVESTCICQGTNCAECQAGARTLQNLMRNYSSSIRNFNQAIKDSKNWDYKIWEIANCVAEYEEAMKRNNLTGLVHACAAKAQTNRVGRGAHNRKKSLFMKQHPNSNEISTLVNWFDDFALNIVADSYTATNVEFYYWGGALQTPPSYAEPSPWDHRDQRWLVHITGRFADNASPLLIAQVYFALNDLHYRLTKNYNNDFNDYQNFVDPSLSFHAWSTRYFTSATLQKLESINLKYNPDDIFRNEMSIPLMAVPTVRSPAPRAVPLGAPLVLLFLLSLKFL